MLERISGPFSYRISGRILNSFEQTPHMKFLVQLRNILNNRADILLFFYSFFIFIFFFYSFFPLLLLSLSLFLSSPISLTLSCMGDLQTHISKCSKMDFFIGASATKVLKGQEFQVWVA